MGKAFDRFVEIVHGQGNAVSFEMEDLEGLGGAAVLGGKSHGQFAFSLYNGVGGAVLVAECVTADDDGGGPVGDQPGNVRHDDRLAENGAVEDIADRAVGAFPHLFQVEFLHAGFIGGDGGAFDAYSM